MNPLKRIALVCGGFGLLLAMFALVARMSYDRGVDVGAAEVRDSSRQVFLDSNRAYQHRLDSLDAAAARRIAAADSAIARAKRDSRVARLREDSVLNRISIVSDSSVSIDSQPPKPADPVLITAIQRGIERRRLDSIAIIGLEHGIADRDGRLRIQSLSIQNLVQRDSVQLEQIDDLRKEVRSSKRAAFRKGLGWGAAGATFVLGALAIVLEE